jgi:hypothetical protein
MVAGRACKRTNIVRLASASLASYVSYPLTLLHSHTKGSINSGYAAIAAPIIPASLNADALTTGVRR